MEKLEKIFQETGAPMFPMTLFVVFIPAILFAVWFFVLDSSGFYFVFISVPVLFMLLIVIVFYATNRRKTRIDEALRKFNQLKALDEI